MEVNIDVKLREKVADYINKDARRKTVDEGLFLLEQTGYKPNVFENFSKNKMRRDIPVKLDRVLRSYLRYPINPLDPDHQDIEGEIPAEVNVNLEMVEKEISTSQDDAEYPETVKKALESYSDLYKQRSMLHKQLKEIGESNSDEDVRARKNIASAILGISHQMDVLWTAFAAYKESGDIPSEEIIQDPFDPEKIIEKEPVKLDIELAEDLEGLKKQNNNWRIKIAKAENKLLYQSEKKLKKENPMPEGPKRLELEKRIERLKAEKLQIEYAIAEKK